MSEQIITQVEPSDEFNTNMITTYERNLRERNSVLHQILHTAIGGIPSHRKTALFYEDKKTYISNEAGIIIDIE